jgi:IS1 family transposase
MVILLCQEKNVAPEKQGILGYGDVWTWTAIDADTKLVPCWHIGRRDANAAYEFMTDLASRLKYRVMLTTDGLKAYLEAVESAFGADIDYAQLIKIYGKAQDEVRYSPAECIGCEVRVITGDPFPPMISTSYVERQNLTMRMSMRRFTRLTNAFSKKLENLRHAVSLYFMHYNFAGYIRVCDARQRWKRGHKTRLGDRRYSCACRYELNMNVSRKRYHYPIFGIRILSSKTFRAARTFYYSF